MNEAYRATCCGIWNSAPCVSPVHHYDAVYSRVLEIHGYPQIQSIELPAFLNTCADLARPPFIVRRQGDGYEPRSAVAAAHISKMAL